MAAARVLAFKHTTVFEISYAYSICATKRFNFSFHLGNAKIQKHCLKREQESMKAFRRRFRINSSGSLPPTPALLQGGLKNNFNN